MRAVVITVSDSASRGTAPDTAGPAVIAVIRGWSGASVEPRLVPDDEDAIVAVLRDAIENGIDLVVTVGGTGCAERDVTPEATRRVVDRDVPGLAEAMRQASAGVHPHAWLSRAVAGIAARTLIVNVPGSERGAVENLQAVAGLIPHAVASIRGEASHPDADARRHGGSD